MRVYTVLVLSGPSSCPVGIAVKSSVLWIQRAANGSIDKESMLHHTCPHKALRKIKWPFVTTRLTAHFTCSLMSGLEICKHEKEHGHSWYWMPFLRPSVIRLHKMQTYTVNSVGFPYVKVHWFVGPRYYYRLTVHTDIFMHCTSPYKPTVYRVFIVSPRWTTHTGL